jgi:DNA repair photolyase
MTGNMFNFIDKTWNPIAGGYTWSIKTGETKKTIITCPYRCSYCWARGLINRNQWKKYLGSWRIHPPEIGRKFKPGSTVFVCDMIDIGAPGIPEDPILRILEAIRAQPEVTFLLMTKNPIFYRSWSPSIPENTIWGATIETNRVIDYRISRAPDTAGRLVIMERLAEEFPDQRLFIGIEPIMDFDLDVFVNQIWKTKPWAVAVGYDNYGNKLPEPPQAQTERLIKTLERFTTVYRKNIREAWDRPLATKANQE